MDKLKVLVVDDSIVYRKFFKVIIESTGLATVGKTASNGIIALERLAQEYFDIILVELFMLEMDGLETLERIKTIYPEKEVIIMSSKSNESVALTVEAFEKGAIDVVLKPSELEIERNTEQIRSHLKVIFAQIKMNKNEIESTKTFKKSKEKNENTEKIITHGKNIHIDPELILMVSSTGGPVALEKIFMDLPRGIDKPILVVQHMPSGFTKSMSKNLDYKCELKVAEACSKDLIKKGKIMIAPGGCHMLVKNKNGDNIIELEKTEYINGVRPSADILFESVAKVYRGKSILSIVLTGMGNDGMRGIKKLKKYCNCYTITQSENSCVIYGMPRSVYEAGLSDEVVALNNISKRIIQIVLGIRS